MAPSIEPVPLSLECNPEDSPEWKLFRDLIDANARSLHSTDGISRFKGDGFRFKGNWRIKSNRDILGTPWSFENAPAQITHELAAYKARWRRLLSGRVIAPDYCVQYGNADQEANQRKCQILMGRRIVWRGWDEHPCEIPHSVREELIEHIRRFRDALKEHLGRR